eukprot:7244661-Alexandrium_andersonii.AAC.1
MLDVGPKVPVSLSGKPRRSPPDNSIGEAERGRRVRPRTSDISQGLLKPPDDHLRVSSNAEGPGDPR